MKGTSLRESVWNEIIILCLLNFHSLFSNCVDEHIHWHIMSQSSEFVTSDEDDSGSSQSATINGRIRAAKNGKTLKLSDGKSDWEVECGKIPNS